MKLYASLTSPYARKVRITLIELSIDHEFVEESPVDPESQVAQLNPLGKVPLLELDDGEVLFDSPMIVEYLDGLTEKSLLPDDLAERWPVQRWHALGDGIADAVVARLLEARRDEDKQDKAFIARQEGKVAAALAFASAHLSRDEFLCGADLTMADIAMAVALDYTDLRYPHDWRAQHLELARWLTAIGRRPSFSDTIAP
jgi:glutathione S-transferase